MVLTDVMRVISRAVAGFDLRNRRAWVSLLVGVILVGVGIGMMLTGGLGVSPADVLVSGLSRATGFSVGLIMVICQIVFISVAWFVGVRPGFGTVACVLLIGPAIDLTLFVTEAIWGPLLWPVWGFVVWWVAGLFVFTLGVLGLFAANLGMSGYDQLTRATSVLMGRSLGLARLVTDGLSFVVGVFLGGSWGVGTVIVLFLVPAALNRALPRVRSLVVGGSSF